MSPLGKIPLTNAAHRFVAYAVENLSSVGKECAKPVEHHCFEVASRNADTTRTAFRGPSHQGGGYIVPITLPLLDAMSGGQPPSSLIEQNARQQAWLLGTATGHPCHAVFA